VIGDSDASISPRFDAYPTITPSRGTLSLELDSSGNAERSESENFSNRSRLRTKQMYGIIRTSQRSHEDGKLEE